jgi:DNA N-6-adenine-methyltransferase (Dam)
MALHEQAVGATDEWYTPAYVFNAMGVRFDADVASPGSAVVPWIPADHHITADSLTAEWQGFLWMNAPFGPRNGLVPWLRKFRNHGNGVCLVPDRTSAPWWQQYAPTADLVLFVSPKIRFIGADGRPGVSPAQGTCLLAFGSQGVGALQNAAEAGLGTLMLPAAK